MSGSTLAGTVGPMLHRSTVLLVIALALAGCIPQIPTAAHVFRFDRAGAFQACQVWLGWTESELVDRCGPALRRVSRLGGDDGEACLIYGTRAHAIGVNDRTAPFYAICVAPRRRTRASSGGGSAALEGRVSEPERPSIGLEVVGVYGLASVPEGFVPGPTSTSTVAARR